MKFCDKLSKLRKENNYSQEQFADKMNVSRQAVSKWESGASYPDMDKIISMCKILNCNLDDLMDDGVIEKKEESKINFNNYFNEFLSFITKTYNMFWSMTFKEKIKCLFELFIIFIILFIFGALIFSVISNLFIYNINSVPKVGEVVASVIESLVIITLVIVGLVIFLHLFKIRYLDYFVTIEGEDVTEKTKEEAINEEKMYTDKKYITQREKEKIIIRDPKHSKYNFFNILEKIILGIIKAFVIMFSIPILITIFFIIMLMFMSFTFVKYGALFIFTSIALVGALLIGYVILYFIYNFIFNRKIKFKLMFYIFISGLIIMSGFIGLSALNFLDYDLRKVNESDYTFKEENIEMEDGLFINFDNVKYTIDNNINNIKLIIKVPKTSTHYIYKEKEDNLVNLHIYEDSDIFRVYKDLKKDIEKKQISDYDYELNIEVISNEENIKNLKNNYNNYYQED